ncbi:MAG: hypothetical protein JNJ53_05175 [Rhizobiales bacterium]|nr:hypothetical protein [Hyphomicrobiales bacterium]
MSMVSRSSDTWASHAVCLAAGARDGLRTAQFFVRLLSGAEDWGRKSAVASPDVPAPRTYFFSPFVSKLASMADRFMTWTVDCWIALVIPEWRKLPSPFNRGMLNEVSQAIRADSFVANPLFNTYFYRAAIHILRRYRSPPYLVLEHRVDQARRKLTDPAIGAIEDKTAFLALALIDLADAAPIARAGELKLASAPGADVDANVSIFAIACVALLFAEEGKPSEELDEDQFFASVGALIGPRLDAMAEMISRSDAAGLARELAEIKGMY